MGQTVHQIAGLLKDLGWAARSTARPADWIRISVDFILGRVMKWARVPFAGRERSVKLRDGTTLCYRLDRADLWVIHEIWVCEVYRPVVGTSPSVIVDIGANIGLASLWFVKRLGAIYVIAVEPSPANARMVRMNFARNGIKGTILEAAVGPSDRSALFLEHESSTCGRLQVDGAVISTASAHCTVNVLSMASVLKNLPDDLDADLVKIDIEGGEGPLLTGDVSWMSRVGSMVVEFHPSLVDYPTLLDVLDTCGFHRAAGTPIAGQPIDFFIQSVPVDGSPIQPRLLKLAVPSEFGADVHSV